MRATGAQLLEVVLEGLDALAHAGGGVLLDVVEHGSRRSNGSRVNRW